MAEGNPHKEQIYLITGINGNLGRYIAERLLMEKKRVRGMAPHAEYPPKELPEQVEVTAGSVTDKAALGRLFRGNKQTEFIVIHCEETVCAKPGEESSMYRTNVEGTRNILDASIGHCVKKFVYIGSAFAVPETAAGTLITEPEEYCPSKIKGHYGKSKAMACQEVLDAVHNWNLDASILLPAWICGPDDCQFGPVTRFITDFYNGDIQSGIKGTCNLTDARDVANAAAACCTAGEKGESYIVSGECVSMDKIFSILGALTGVLERKAAIPGWLAKLMALYGDCREKITGSPAQLNSHILYGITRNNAFDNYKARRDLGYKARPTAQSISDTIEWLKAEQKTERGGGTDYEAGFKGHRFQIFPDSTLCAAGAGCSDRGLCVYDTAHSSSQHIEYSASCFCADPFD